MIKENQKYFNRLHVIIDGIIIFLAFSFSYFVRFTSNWIAHEKYYPDFRRYAGILPIAIPAYLLLYAAFHLYQPKRYLNKRSEFWNLLKANITGIGILMGIFYLVNPAYFSRIFLFIFAGSNFLLCYIYRSMIRVWLHAARKNGMNLKHIIIIGFSPAAAAYIDRVKNNPHWGYMIHGILDDQVAPDFEYRKIPWVGRIDDLPRYLEANTLDEVAITISLNEYSKLEKIVSICEKSGTHTKFVPDYYNFISTNPYTEDLDGLPVINIRNVPLTNTVNKMLKRIIDIIGSLIAIILFSPIMLVTAILVKKSSEGPIIFKQTRVGLGNKEFSMYKFRSMGVQKASQEKTGWTTKNDPRVTPIGRIIRKTSIDELPQLFNVLKGDMSLVGPRPERPQFVMKFREEIPRYMIKHQVRPGITGWAQVNGFRGDTSIRGRIDHDLYYIENWTLLFDIKILFLTIFKGFINENAY
ncbi:MAG: undecaprenyl-phosphate glucose phosphotransferase [Lachnospiraceae bacterium]